MQIMKGKWRIVFLFPKQRIAIKIAKIHFLSVAREIFLGCFRDWRLAAYDIRWMFDSEDGRQYLCGGIRSNWNEFLFYLRSRNPLLQPTYFSLLGLINIQQYAKPHLLQNVDVWCQLNQLVGNAVWDDGHHFADARNFCLVNNSLRMLDYGSRRCHRVIQVHGEEIAKNFDPLYSWEEEKKKF